MGADFVFIVVRKIDYGAAVDYAVEKGRKDNSVNFAERADKIVA